MSETLVIARKELSAFFGSPVAYLFIGAFLAAVLFVFFWVEAFFARNIADARPLFDWMPLLLIFLAAALTMRLWSEERRSGTLELLATLPVPTWRLVLGKFLAVWALVAIALTLTLPLPVTVALLGPLDWGPVLGAYLATLLLAAAYLSIGLYVSARTDNAIVALIGTTLIAAALYLIGSPALTGLVGHGAGELLRLLGTGARFESITRGVLDLRDLYYYLSLVGVFLTLTIHALERLRWAEHGERRSRHHTWTLVTLLVAANLLAANLWLQPLAQARADLTQGQAFTLSEASEHYLEQLQEPLLIRGYFSSETHPLLAPLVPRLRDLLREYRTAGGGRVVVEFADPRDEPELEREAGERYGIEPVAFQTASKYQAGVVNAYFHILIQYGDAYEVLDFRDLIDVKVRSEADLDVVLRNPEYDLTRAIKRLLYDWRGGDDPFAALGAPLRLEAYVSAPEGLPEPMQALRSELEALLEALAARGGDRFRWEITDPDEDPATTERIAERYGLQPLLLDLLDPQPFHFGLVLRQGERTVTVPLPEQLDRAGLERNLEAAIRRFTPGVLRSVALYTPAPQPAMPGLGDDPGLGYSLLEEALREDLEVIRTDLTDGQIPAEADLLLVVAPRTLDARQRFAIDQFLMQGGSVMVAAAALDVRLDRSGITATATPTGLEDWLGHLGITLGPGLVLDPQNTPFPIPVQRQVGGFLIEELQVLPYPYFPDVRADGLDSGSGITAGLDQLTMTWASPIEVAADSEAQRVIRLVESSPDSWSSARTDLQPDLDRYPQRGFPRDADSGRRLLAVALEGRFTSAFAGRPSPLRDGDGIAETRVQDADGTQEEADAPAVSAVVERSPASARLILFGSDSFLSDTAIGLATEATQSRYRAPLTLVQNAIDWSLEDRGLLALRGRGQFTRLLEPVGGQQRMLWEALNYLLALAGLGLVFLLHRRLRRRRERALQAMLEA